MLGMMGVFEPAKRAFARVYRRLFTGHATARTPEDNVAWQERQFRYHATPSYYTGPLTLPRTNPTGETWEMRQAYRQWTFAEPAAKASLLTKCIAVAQLDGQYKSHDKRNKWDRDAKQWADHAIAHSTNGLVGLVMNMLLPGCMDGYSLNEKVFGHVDAYSSPYHRRWTIREYANIDTDQVRFVIDQYRQVTAVQSIAGTQTAYALDPQDFVLFTHLKVFENPFGVSDMRAAVRACRLIESAIRLRHILLTNHSGPFLKATAGDAGARKKLLAVMENARANGYIVTDPTTTMEVINLATANLDTFRATIEDYRQEIVQAIQGAYLQLLEGSNPNARGDTQVQSGIAQLFVWWLAVQVAQVVNQQVIPDLCVPTYGYQAGFPTLTLGGIDEEFLGRMADRFKKGQDLGVALSEEQVRDSLGLESPLSAADALKPAQQGQGGQGGGSDPFAGLFGNGDNQDGGGNGNGAGPPPQLPTRGQPRSFAVSHGGTPRPVLRTAVMDGPGRPLPSWVWESLPPGVFAFDPETLEFAEWRPYTNPRSNKSGWISEGGQVRYEDPRKKDEAKKTARTTSADTVARAIQHPERLDVADVAALHAHFKTLDAPTLRGIARSLGGKLGKAKKDYGDKIVAAVKEEGGKRQATDAARRTAEASAEARSAAASLDAHPAAALDGHHGIQARGVISQAKADIDRAASTGDRAKIRQSVAEGRAGLDMIHRDHQDEHQRAVNQTTQQARRHVAELNTHPALQHQSPTQRRRALASYQESLDTLSRAALTGDADHVNRVAAAGRAALDRLQAIPFRPRGPRGGPAATPPAAGPGPAKRVNTRSFIATHDAPAACRQLFGRDVTTPEHKGLLAAAVNGSDGSSVEVRGVGGQVQAITTGVGYQTSRQIYKEGGKLVCKNGCFFMKFDPDPGNPGPPKDWRRISPVSGTDLLANQVRALSELGVSKIKTYAARSDSPNPNDAMNGYYTWPRLGYDSEIPSHCWRRLPQPLKDLVTSNPVGSTKENSVLSLMTTEEGRRWWKEHGDGLHSAEFDLTPGSLSMRTHLAYLRERAARGGRE